MISGKVALGGLTLEFGKEKERFDRLTQEAEALMRAHTKLLEEEKGLVEELARTYLPELSPEAVTAGLDALRERMQSALTERDAHRRELENRLARLPEDISRNELLLAEAERAEEHAAAALDGVRASIEAALGDDEVHTRNVAEHRAIMERRSILQARRARLSTTASVERRKYDEDPVFAYLTRRRYGEPEYRGRLLGRWLDGWLAGRSDFAELQRNYRILEHGPRTMLSEIHELSKRAEELERQIDRQESEVGARFGLTAALESEEAAQRRVVEARRALTDARSRHDRLAAEMLAVDANRGRPYEDAIAIHREFLEDRTIAELLDLARATADPKDDELVRSLEEIRSRLETIGRKLTPLRQELERRASSTTSLGTLARNALAQFTSRRSRFPEEFRLGELVESLLEGDLDLDDAFERIAAAHHKQPLLVPSDANDFEGWFADLSSRYDPELGAVSVQVDQSGDIDSEVVVYDHHGRVLHRRVTRRREHDDDDDD